MKPMPIVGAERERRRAGSWALWILLGCGLLLPSVRGAAQEDFIRGDTNSDGRVSLADVARITATLFGSHPGGFPCRDAADVEDLGIIGIQEAEVLFLRLFATDSIHEISPPRGEPGPDATPVDPLDCAAYEINAAPRTEEILRLGDIEASPGELVAVPVLLTAEEPTSGLQLIIRYAPGEFLPEDQLYRDAFYSGAVSEQLVTSGRGLSSWDFPEEGALRIGFLLDFLHTEDVAIPPGEDLRAASILGRVPFDALPGTEIRLELGEHEDELGLLESEISHLGAARLPRTVGGSIRVTEPVEFVRGDANRDGDVDISDPVYILLYLFVGGPEPACPDAADADDSGIIELTDAVRILRYYFLGEGRIAPPYPEARMDGTIDALSPCR